MKHWRDMDSSERHAALREHGGLGTGDLNRAPRASKLYDAPPIAPEDAKIFGGIWSMSDDARRQHNYRRMVEGARKARAAQQ